MRLARLERNSTQIWAGEPRGWSRRQTPRAARPWSSRPSCRLTMLQTTGRVGLLPARVAVRTAMSTSRTPEPGGAPRRSSLKSGTLLFLRSTVEVVVASSSHAIEQPAPAQPKEPAVASPDESPGTSCWMPCDSHLCLATQAACLQCPVGCVQRPRHQLPFNAQVWRSAACPHGDPSSELR